MFGWVLLTILTAACGGGLWLLFRSFRRWQQPPPTDWVAESELWSARNMSQR